MEIYYLFKIQFYSLYQIFSTWSTEHLLIILYQNISHALTIKTSIYIIHVYISSNKLVLGTVLDLAHTKNWLKYNLYSANSNTSDNKNDKMSMSL